MTPFADAAPVDVDELVIAVQAREDRYWDWIAGLIDAEAYAMWKSEERAQLLADNLPDYPDYPELQENA